MEIVGCCNNDYINVFIAEKLFTCIVIFDASFGCNLMSFGIDVVYADKLNSVNLNHFFGMETAHSAIADYRTAESFLCHN